MGLFILRHVVITLFTFCTCQCDSYTHNFHLALLVSLRQRISAVFLGIKKKPASIRPFSVPYYHTGSQAFSFIMRTPSGSVYPRVLPPSRTVLASVSRCRTLPVLSVLTDRDTVRSDGRHVGHTDPDGCSCYNDKEISGRYVHTSDTQTRTAVPAQMTNGYTDDMSTCRTLRSGRLFLL